MTSHNDMTSLPGSPVGGNLPLFVFDNFQTLTPVTTLSAPELQSLPEHVYSHFVAPPSSLARRVAIPLPPLAMPLTLMWKGFLFCPFSPLKSEQGDNKIMLTEEKKC